MRSDTLVHAGPDDELLLLVTHFKTVMRSQLFKTVQSDGTVATLYTLL